MKSCRMMEQSGTFSDISNGAIQSQPNVDFNHELLNFRRQLMLMCILNGGLTPNPKTRSPGKASPSGNKAVRSAIHGAPGS